MTRVGPREVNLSFSALAGTFGGASLAYGVWGAAVCSSPSGACAASNWLAVVLALGFGLFLAGSAILLVVVQFRDPTTLVGSPENLALQARQSSAPVPVRRKTRRITLGSIALLAVGLALFNVGEIEDLSLWVGVVAAALGFSGLMGFSYSLLWDSGTPPASSGE